MTRWTLDDLPDLTGRTALVTGANAGLGWWTARGLARGGAHVILACRDPRRAAAAAEQLREDLPNASLELRTLDLADLASVASLADDVRREHDRLDLLINNAGIMAVDEARTVDGFELQVGVNHLGHFALTGRLLPLLVASPGSRVVTVSSLGHRAAGRLRRDDLLFERSYDRWRPYFQSKLANLLFTLELDRRLRAEGAPTAALAAHPGSSHTDLGTEGSSWVNRASAVVAPLVTQPASQGALPTLRAATDTTLKGGTFVGPRFRVAGRPRVETPARAARRTDDAAWLWERSTDLTGVEPLVPR
ncbi:SDR family NAD(P)-dependent oxidoreductase [Nitriliruptoraceae bacterium ZYF776]|nr:SDR family NAD(P)-dependent oxidoreductase [Profundirhabdus halotolerans]